MIITKLYKYDSSKPDYKGEDFSKYIMVGDISNDDLTEVMGTVELTLAGLPIAEEFAPTTKFIYEKWEETLDENGEKRLEKWQDWHLCVMEDVTSKPILSDDRYYDHHITFTEASALAQGRLVDNISITYKLQDVKIEGVQIIDLDSKAKYTKTNVETTPDDTFGWWNWAVGQGLRSGRRYRWAFRNWYAPTSDYYGQEEDWTNFGYYQGVETGQVRRISLPMPLLEILNGVQGETTFSRTGFGSTEAMIIETDLTTNKNKVFKKISNPFANNATENAWVRDWQFINSFQEEQYYKGRIHNRRVYSGGEKNYWRKVAEFATDEESAGFKLEFDIKPNCRYTIKVRSRMFYSDSFDYSQYKYDTAFPTYKCFANSAIGIINTNEHSSISLDLPEITLQFVTYAIGEDEKVWLNSAPPENAYTLYQKSQINTQNVIKKQGVPINETPLTFYLSEEDVNELKNTTIIENFYNQKNLWELQLEIGKYIHAIPKIRFGDDDRLITTWQRLGQTKQYEDNATHISIFNSRNIENYISACSSYVINMVQLGGIIDEWVAPKSSSEDYLVYNDVAEIITSKKIIEIVDMEVKRVYKRDGDRVGIQIGEVRNLAGKPTSRESKNGYVFSKNVYELLSVDATKSINKGLAIYYDLGTNIIQGLSYRLPTINTGDADNDYAIKRIIGHAYGLDKSLWHLIKVNDYIFHIVYRTKDTVRSDQTRPDLRKYLLNSKYDRIPLHNQFNNQTDIVVDSVKFGNNVYGKLIRTGNRNYTIREWCTNLWQVKKVGELYRLKDHINGEDDFGDNIYYVAKVESTYFQDHIISEVTYSKDYNQLSEIIGIPSEPRFYEISEVSSIGREVSISDYLVLGTSIKSEINENTFIRSGGWTYIHNLLLGGEEDFPKYAITVFKNDVDRKYGSVSGNENFYKAVCHPVSTYSAQNTFTIEWDMIDNFSAGDLVSRTTLSTEPDRVVDTAYNTLEPVRYTDVYGRSDLIDFIILDDIDLSNEDVLELPNSPLRTRYLNYNYLGVKVDFASYPTQSDINNTLALSGITAFAENDYIIASVSETLTKKVDYIFVYKNGEWVGELVEEVDELAKPKISDQSNMYLFGNESLNNLGDNAHGIGLLKDNRETISVNYNLQMLTDSDRFVLSSYLWQPNKTNIKLVLLNSEINKISNATIENSQFLGGEDAVYDIISSVDSNTGVIRINIGEILDGVDLTNAEAIAIISENNINDVKLSNAKYFVFGRNIGGLSETDAKADWYISNFNSDLFIKQ